MTAGSRSIRKALFVSAALATAVMSCGREPTGPGGDGARYSHGIAFQTEFPTAYTQYAAALELANQSAGDVGAFTRVRIVLRFPDGTIAKDTVIDFPPGVDEIPVPLSIVLPSSVPAGGVTLSGNLNYLNAAGQTVWTADNIQAPVAPAAPGSPPPPPIVVVPKYAGPGATATAVRITPKTLTVNTGGGFSFSAVALDAAGNVMPGTPISFVSGNSVQATVDASTGAGTAGSTRGTVTIFARLLTGITDGAVLTVVAPPSSIQAVSGSGQSADVNAQLANPVVVQVNASDGQPAAGVTVTFAAQNGGTVGAATVVTGANGQASTTWRLGGTAGAQTLTASAAGLTGSPVSFTATALALDPVRLEFVQHPPTTATAGAVIAPAITVQAINATNALAPTFTGPVTIALAAGAPAGAVLTGTTTVNAVAGVATFSTLALNLPGTYAFVATNPGLLAASSSSLTIAAGAANRLVFQNYPTAGTVAGATLDQITVFVRDALGNAVTGFTGPITLALAPASAGVVGGAVAAADSGANVVLTGPITVNAVAGVATFSSLQLTQAGSFTLTASGAGLTSATGVAFAVTPGAASTLTLVSGGNQSAAGGAALSAPIVVKVSDNFGNGIAGVTVSFTPAATNGTANPTSAVTTAGGTAQTNWTIGGTAGPQTLNVSGSGLTPNPLAVSATATTTTVAGPATQLVFSQQPTTTAAGAPFSPAIQLTAKDAGGLVATTFTGNVTVGISTNPGDGSLAGTLTVAAVAGVATFPGLSINNTGIGYTLQATSSLPMVTSAAFNITGGAIISTTLNTHLDSLYSYGDQVTKVATSRDATEAVVAGSYTWVSRNTAVATVNGSGLVTAVADGATYVVVTEAGGTKDSTRVVVQQRVATINVTPGTRNIYRTRTFQFTAAAVDGRGNVMPAVTSFVWSTLAPTVASTDANGLVTGVSLGGTQVRATANGITGVAAVNVLTPITRIIVGRDSSGVPVSDTTALASLGIRRAMRAEARDTLDAPMTGVTFAWTSSNGSVALLDTIQPSRATALSNANGNTTIHAMADGITGSAPLKVQQLLSSIELTPTPDTIGVTGTVQLTARGKDANNRYITGGAFTYASNNTSVATVSASGVVTGQSLGNANVTATSGAITSNAAAIVVHTTVPAIISFGRDTLTVGRGAAASIPIFLSRPNGTAVTVNLSARDTNAYFSAASVTFNAGETAKNVTLNGRNAGTTELYALESTGNGFKGDTATVAVQANIHFNTSSWSLNATDQVAAQVLLSDPSPAGGTYVTFSYGTAGRAQVSPDPAFIPAGQLASNVVITALGSTNGSTTITPVATGVNGTAATMNVYAPTLTFNVVNDMVGAGQYMPDRYVQTQVNTNFAVPITFTSSDTNIVTVTPSSTIPGGSYYSYFTMFGKAPGTAMVIVTATAGGWRPDTIFMKVTTPRVVVTGQTSFNTTSPQTTMTIYATDSIGNAHYRNSSLALSVSSSDTSVIKIVDTSPSIGAGAYYVNTVRYQPGGSGGTAWVKVTAGGHRPDSMLVTVVGPKLQFSFTTNRIGAGQYDDNNYAHTPNNVVNPLPLTFTSSNPAKATITANGTVPAGSYYFYFTVTALDTGTVQFIVSAPGYQPDTATYVVTSPRVGISGGGTRNNFSQPSGFTIYSSDSTHQHAAHNRATPLAVSLRSTDTTVMKVDSATATIAAGLYYHNTARVRPTGVGTAYLVAEAPGHRPDSVLYTIITPKIQFSWHTQLLGRRQYRYPTDLYVHVPDNRVTALPITFTQKNAAVDSLRVPVDSIVAGLYYAYVQPHGKAVGTDTIIVSAPGYLPDTAFVRVTTPRLHYGGGLPGSAQTTSSPSTVTIYATDSTNNAHYAMDTVVVRAVSSDTTVIKPTQSLIKILPGAYYVQPQVQYVGPGSASITYSDTTSGGYLQTTTNTVTVTGPSLIFAGTTARYGMRQRGHANDYYIYTQNNVASPVTVTLTSSAPVVATVPATVTIPAGSYYAYFTITAQDTVGTIQITASAPGFGPPATPVTVTVTQPKFVISTTANPRTTAGPQTITVYATDDQGNAHYVTENVVVGLASSSGAIFTTDSSKVTIVAGNYYTQAGRVLPQAVGSAQLTAFDCTGVGGACPPTRSAIHAYNQGAHNINVIHPNVQFSWGSVTLGLGQYIDSNYDGSYYVHTSDNQAAPLPVTLTHIGSARATTLGSVTVPSGLYYAYVRLTGAVRGTDSLVATASSPFHNPDTAFTVVDSGRVDGILSWPTGNVAVGDSVLVTLRTLSPDLGSVRRVAAATTFALAPNANIEFRVGGAVVTSVTVPADGSQVQFYVKAKTAGTGTATIANPNYKTYTPPSITVVP
jgi:hypothetical protein